MVSIATKRGISVIYHSAALLIYTTGLVYIYTTFTPHFKGKRRCISCIIAPRVNNKRGECLTPFGPVIDNCADIKQLLFRITYRLASIFSHITTKAIPDTRACVQLDIQVHHEEHRSVA